MEFITVDHDGPITTITLNRPASMNAINVQMHHELQSAFDTFAGDAAQHVCIVTGAGDRAFCAGSDIKAAASDGFPAGYPRSGYAGLIERFDCPKPFIASVNGLALGGGFEIVLACDIVVAADTASFGLPEPLIGAVALGGGLHRLARQIPLKQAMGVVLSSRRISATDGLRMGFVNEVVSRTDLATATRAWVDDILRASPMAVRTSKAVIHRGLEEPSVEAAMQHQPGYPEFMAWRQSDDAKEGPRAFSEKRKPAWTGR